MYGIDMTSAESVEDVMHAVLDQVDVEHGRGSVMDTPWGIYIGVDGLLSHIVNRSGDVEEVG